MKIGWLGNREKHFNNYQYVKNALSNTHYLFFGELIKRGYEVHYIGLMGKSDGTRKDKAGKLEQENQFVIENFNKLDLDKRFTISIEDKVKVNTSWMNVKVNETFSDFTQSYLDSDIFPDDLDILWIDNFMNHGSLANSCYLNALLKKFPKALVFVYDEVAEWVEGMFDPRIDFGKDRERIIVLGTFSREARYWSFPARGVESFFYCFDKDNVLDVCRNPKVDLQYFGRMVIGRNTHYNLVFNESKKFNFQVHTDLNLSKYSKECIIDDQTILQQNNQTHFLKKYPDIHWELNYTLPCNMYRIYNEAYCTFVPVVNHRANYGLISLRPWEAVISGTLPFYTQHFYEWQEFTSEDFILDEGENAGEIIEYIKGLSFAQRKSIVKANRERFEKFDYRNMVNQFEKLIDLYSNRKYSHDVPFIKKENVLLTDLK